MIKSLVQHGNSKALVIDKAILQAAGLDETALFQILVDPNGGIFIQSVKKMDEELHNQNVDKVLKEHYQLFKNLSKR